MPRARFFASLHEKVDGLAGAEFGPPFFCPLLDFEELGLKSFLNVLMFDRAGQKEMSSAYRPISIRSRLFAMPLKKMLNRKGP